MEKKLNCADCKMALKGSRAESILLVCKNRGGLYYPSPDLCRLARICESELRTLTPLKLTAHSVGLLSSQCTRYAATSDTFSRLACVQAADECHRYYLISSCSRRYIQIRLLHFVKRMRFSSASVRQTLTKKILFLGQ
jgi:hypothetical protein